MAAQSPTPAICVLGAQCWLVATPNAFVCASIIVGAFASGRALGAALGNERVWQVPEKQGAKSQLDRHRQQQIAHDLWVKVKSGCAWSYPQLWQPCWPFRSSLAEGSTVNMLHNDTQRTGSIDAVALRVLTLRSHSNIDTARGPPVACAMATALSHFCSIDQ
jgi:hypothetical protein